MPDETYPGEDEELEALATFEAPNDDDDEDDVDYPDPDDLELDPPPGEEGDDMAAHQHDEGAMT
jgi:hypothetical protein